MEHKGNAYKKQGMLVEELKEISSMIGVDFEAIEEYEKESRTTILELARDKLIRGDIIVRYTLIDELLNMILVRHFFERKNMIQLWKTKRFRNSNYYFLEELSLMQKLRYVKGIKKIPKNIAGEIERLNALRNAIAHTFFPENLRKSKPV